MRDRARGPYRAQRRRARGEDKPGLAWQDRDTDLLAAVWHNRWLTRDLLLVLFPPGDPPAHIATPKTPKQPGTNLDRRLAKLFHHGYLDRTRTEYGGPLIYALTRAGADKLTLDLTARGEKPTPENTRRLDERNRTVKPQSVDHTLAIARVRVCLTAAMHGTSWTLDRFQREGEDLKAEWTAASGLDDGRAVRRYVVPDAFVILKDESAPAGKQRHALFVEVDRSTMPAHLMAKKFAAYSQLYTARMHVTRFRVPTFRVATVTKSAERAENLRRLVRGEFTPPHHKDPTPAPVPPAHRSFFYFTDEAQFTAAPSNVLAAVWLHGAADANEREAIVPRPLPRA